MGVAIFGLVYDSLWDLELCIEKKENIQTL